MGENASGVRRVDKNASGIRRVETHQGSERWKCIRGQKGGNASGVRRVETYHGSEGCNASWVTRMETHQGQLSLKTSFKGHIYMNKCRKTVIFKDRF